MSKEAWKAAKATLQATEAERKELIRVAVEGIRERYEAAQEALEEIEESSPERVGICEGCSDPIWEGERYSYDGNNHIYHCEPCSPTYGDMLADPTSFYDSEGEYMTAETAKAAVDAHLAKGGALTDKMVSA